MPTRLYALALGMLLGCYEPPAASCTISCTPDSGCPGDLSCVENVCVAFGETCELPPLQWRQVTTGATFACGITTEDRLYCWGNHRRGQLGVGDTAVVGDTARPKKVNDKTWSIVSAGAEHACGLVDGVAYCWGHNEDGQVRGEKGGQFTRPEVVVAQLGNEPPKFDTISAGSRHTCAIGEGELWCWGGTEQVGVANVVATRIGNLGDWTQVSAGYDHTCAISAGSGVHCWGQNGQGQVTSPIGGTFLEPTFVDVAGQTAKLIAVGDQTTCAIVGAGELYCWGRNNRLQIDTTRTPTIPTRIGTESGWTDVAIGGDQICGVRAGLAKCWGYDNNGTLGNGVWSLELGEPMATPILTAEKVALPKRGYAGQIDDTPGYLRFACALGGTKIFCWGDNQLGQLAMGTTSMRRTPVLVEPPTAGAKWMQLWGGNEHACAMTTTNALYCWGADFDGQISAGIPRGVTQPCVKDQPCDFAKPTLAPSVIGRVDDLVLGREYSCARDGTTIRCWGRANLGASPSGGIALPRAPMSSVWMKMWGGRYGTCGLTTQGAFACWGNVAGVNTSSPTTITSAELVNISDVSIGDNNMCVHRIDNARVCWGANGEGQVGNGTNIGQPTPLAMDAGQIADIAMGSRHACAATGAGGVLCWGSNQFAQSGGADGNAILSPSPVTGPNGNLTGCTRIAAGDRHSCAICDGNVHCWGQDENGALGRLNTNNTSSSVALSITLENETFVDVVARNYGTCAITVDGKVYCWGTGQYGGNGDGGQSLNLPREIVAR